MLANNKNVKSSETISQNLVNLDPFTNWLIRIACIIIILVFSFILLGIPFLLSFSKSQFNNLIFNSKDLLRNFIELYLN